MLRRSRSGRGRSLGSGMGASGARAIGCDHAAANRTGMRLRAGSHMSRTWSGRAGVGADREFTVLPQGHSPVDWASIRSAEPRPALGFVIISGASQRRRFSHCDVPFSRRGADFDDCCRRVILDGHGQFCRVVDRRAAAAAIFM